MSPVSVLMRLAFGSWLVLWLTACGAATATEPGSTEPGSTEPGSTAEARPTPASNPVEPAAEASAETPAEAPAEAPPEMHSDAPPAPESRGALEPTPSAPRCDPDAPPADARAALVALGNVHTWLEIVAWHSALRWAPRLVEERVVETVTHGRFTVARVARRHVRCLGEEGCEDPQFIDGVVLRVREGQQVFRMGCGDATLPADEAATHALVERCAVLEIPAGRATMDATCWAVGCRQYPFVSTTSRRAQPYTGEVGTAAWLLPGVGAAATVSSDYSPETGDGTTRTRVLMGWRLTTPGPASPVEDPPTSFEAWRRRVHARAQTGAVALREHVLRGVRFSFNPEHVGRASALEAWRNDPVSHAALADALDGACGSVGEVVVCPRPSARPSSCAFEARSTPRAMFVRRGAGWRLGALLLGGVDSVWHTPEWSSDPPRPYSRRER